MDFYPAFISYGTLPPPPLGTSYQNILWFDVSTSTLKRYNGSTWVDLAPAVGGGGGSDPWTYLQVNGGADFTTTSNTAQNVTGLAFTPTAHTTYEFEAILMIRTATANTNPRVGLAWPTGGTDGVAQIIEGHLATGTPLFAHNNINTSLLIAVGGLPNTTQSWPVVVRGTFRAGATPSGDVRIQLASETNGTTVRVVARSFLKYRTLAF